MTDRELLELALDAISGRYEIELDKAEEALRERLAQPEPNVSYTGNGTAGRENMTAPTGFFMQMPKRGAE